jgi:hypothetical protein
MSEHSKQRRTQGSLETLHDLVVECEYLSNRCLGGVTSQEIGDIDYVASLLGISIGKESTVWKLPPKDIGDEDDQSFLWFPRIWSSDICWYSMNRCYVSSRFVCMDGASRTIATRNGRHL